jgi:uncharacterized protein YecT (DUF1311 family)
MAIAVIVSLRAGRFLMRAGWLVAVAILFGLAHPARAQDARSIADKLPLFAKNHCETHRDSANQMMCGDPALNAAGEKLGVAIEERLSRLADRRASIEDNAQWIKDRSRSCGIFGRVAVRPDDFERIKACLMLVTEGRTAVLRDPNFDCLAANSAAGALICSEPTLELGETELNVLVRALIGKLRDDEAQDAFAEYARWIRDRDRKCDLAGKDNMPLSELPPSSEGCLENWLKEMTAGMTAAKNDPKRVFGRTLPASQPNANAVDLCVSQIHAQNSCADFLRVRRVYELDNQVGDQGAVVTAGIEMVVLSPFAVCSSTASNCTGTCWDLRAGKAGPVPPNSRDSFAVTNRLRIEKAFSFQKTDNGRWRCTASALQPVTSGTAYSGP